MPVTPLCVSCFGRLAISRLHADEDEDDARTSEAGNLLQVLESYMHRTGARFTDVFYFLDRRVLRGKSHPIWVVDHVGRVPVVVDCCCLCCCCCGCSGGTALSECLHAPYGKTGGKH